MSNPPSSDKVVPVEEAPPSSTFQHLVDIIEADEDDVRPAQIAFLMDMQRQSHAWDLSMANTLIDSLTSQLEKAQEELFYWRRIGSPLLEAELLREDAMRFYRGEDLGES